MVYWFEKAMSVMVSLTDLLIGNKNPDEEKRVATEMERKKEILKRRTQQLGIICCQNKMVILQIPLASPMVQKVASRRGIGPGLDSQPQLMFTIYMCC